MITNENNHTKLSVLPSKFTQTEFSDSCNN